MTMFWPSTHPSSRQPLPERLNEMWAVGGQAAREITYPVDLPTLLRLGGERRGEESAGQCADERPTRGHSIT